MAAAVERRSERRPSAAVGSPRAVAVASVAQPSPLGEAISPGAAADSPPLRRGGGLSAGHPGFGAQGGLSAALEASARAA